MRHPGCASMYKCIKTSLLSTYSGVSRTWDILARLWIYIQVNQDLPSIHIFRCVTHVGQPDRDSIYKRTKTSLLSTYWGVSHTWDILALSLYTNEPWLAFCPRTQVCHTHRTTWLWFYIQMNQCLPSIHISSSVSHKCEILAEVV